MRSACSDGHPGEQCKMGARRRKRTCGDGRLADPYWRSRLTNWLTVSISPTGCESLGAASPACMTHSPGSLMPGPGQALPPVGWPIYISVLPICQLYLFGSPVLFIPLPEIDQVPFSNQYRLNLKMKVSQCSLTSTKKSLRLVA